MWPWDWYLSCWLKLGFEQKFISILEWQMVKCIAGAVTLMAKSVMEALPMYNRLHKSI